MLNGFNESIVLHFKGLKWDPYRGGQQLNENKILWCGLNKFGQK